MEPLSPALQAPLSYLGVYPDATPCHRAAAAFLAASLRCFLVSAAALAFPPFWPPLRPAAALGESSARAGSGAWCVAPRTTRKATWVKSGLGFLATG